MKIALALSLVLAAVGCKTDNAEQAATPSSGNTASAPAEPESNAKPRSGRIDMPRLRPNAGGGNDGTTDRQPPSLDDEKLRDEERAERREWRQQRREERRKERMEMLDTDKNGQISPEEAQAGRTARAQEMRDRFDENGDGKLSVDELERSRMGRRLDDPATIDTNKDGDISAQELTESMQQMRERFRGMRNRVGGGAGSGSADQP